MTTVQELKDKVATIGWDRYTKDEETFILNNISGGGTDATKVPYVGALSGLDLGGKNMITTGSLYAGSVFGSIGSFTTLYPAAGSSFNTSGANITYAGSFIGGWISGTSVYSSYVNGSQAVQFQPSGVYQSGGIYMISGPIFTGSVYGVISGATVSYAGSFIGGTGSYARVVYTGSIISSVGSFTTLYYPDNSGSSFNTSGANITYAGSFIGGLGSLTGSSYSKHFIGESAYISGTNNISLSNVFISGNGNVGIGTTTPAPSSAFGTSTPVLHIVASGANSGLLRQQSGSDWGSVDMTVGPGNANANVYVQSNHPLRFATNNIERMRIEADGKVGIGDTSPSYKLELVDSSATYAMKIANAATGYGLWITAGDGTQSYRQATFSDSSSNNRFIFYSDGTGAADVGWTTFSPVINKINPTKTDYLNWALEDADKPHKPYNGLKGTEEERNLYGKDAAKIAIGIAKWAKETEQEIQNLKAEIALLKKQVTL